MGANGVFPYGYTFQPGDLALYVTDMSGQPYSPFSVTYTTKYYPKDGSCPVQVGSEKRPVQIDVGSYYATGIAGQCGQPGDWCISWLIQQVENGPLSCQTYCFKVFDSSVYCAPVTTQSSSSRSCGCSGCSLPSTSSCCSACSKFGW